MGAMRLEGRQRTKTSQKTELAVNAENRASSWQYLNKSELAACLDDDMSDLIEQLWEERDQEELQDVDVDLNDRSDDEVTDFCEEEIDPFHTSNKLDAYCRPVWIWTGGKLVWCHAGRGGDPYKEGLGESLRLLIEWSTENYWRYFPWMEDEERQPTPWDSSGIFAPTWLGTNAIPSWNRMTILIPGSTRSLMTVASFFGSYRGGGLPEVADWLWFRRKWLPKWCEENGANERSFLDQSVSWTKTPDGAVDGWMLHEQHQTMIKNDLVTFVKKGWSQAGLDSKRIEDEGKPFAPFGYGRAQDQLKNFRCKIFDSWKKRLRRELNGEN